MADNEQTIEVPPSSPVAAAAPAATVGETLRAARIARDLTVEQLATELRIEARQLTAIEENRFEQIGVPVFVKGYIRQFGQRCGVDVADLLALYYQQGKVADVEVQPNRTIKLRDERQASSWIVAALVLATIIVGFAAWWWSGDAFELPTDEAVSAPVAAPAAVGVPGASVAPTPSVSQAPAAALAATPTVPAVVDAAPTSAAPAVPATNDAPERATTAVTIPLEFTFAAESWAEVSDARGERLLFGLNASGRQVTVRGEPPFAILLGNADSVQLRVDGENYVIPTTGRQGNLARFSVDIAEE